MLYGRGAEQDRVDQLLSRARKGESGALVIHGEAGIGKTALLAHAAQRTAEGHGRVLRTVGIESEMELPFGGLHQLLRSVADRLDPLHVAQASALRAALGLTGGPAGDRFTMGAAVLAALAEVASDGPLLCLVDDAQWLDGASLDALTFAARRLHGEGVVMLFGLRDGVRADAVTGLPRLHLQGLDPLAVHTLLADRVPDLSPFARGRIIEQSCGNPLALLELPAALTAEQRAGRVNPITLPAGLVTPASRIQESFQEQVRRLPDPTRTMLLVAAADDSGDLDLLLRASTRLGTTLEDLEPAEAATLVQLTEHTLTFRHPLVRSATYQDAALARRVAAHRALAEALAEHPAGTLGTPATGNTHADRRADRRAWHLAAATTGTDEAVAEAMEEAAIRAGGRRGAAAASAAYERAAQLTADPARRTRLLAAAAFTSAEAAQFPRTAALTDRIDALALDPATFTDLARVRAIVELDQGSPRRAAHILMECADRIRSSPDRDSDLAAVLAEALQAAQSSGAADLIAEAETRMAALPADSAPGAGFPERITAGGRAQLRADHVAAHREAAACVRDCRAQHVIGWLPTSLHLLAQAQSAIGRYQEAGAAAEEGLAVAEEFGRNHRGTYLRATLATLAALRGDGERCTTLATAALAYADPHGINLAAAHAHRALGLLALGLGRAEDALAQLEAADARVDHPTLSAPLLPDLVEAAVRAGCRDRTAEPMSRLEAWASAAGQPAATALLHRCRALTEASNGSARTQAVAEHFAAALHAHTDGPVQPFEHGRTELLFGEWLRRERRRTDARHRLHAALETFETLGALPWASRARTELQAIGEPLSPDTATRSPLARLSPQEREVVRLAAGGATNREIATQLFLSPRTVGHHLYRAFPKLGITSRTDLPSLLDRSTGSV
ncbi:AAA family ATPase [Streptomyces sp. 5-8]|uniref:AAA family ATPase n=1 Tax=Streptomyces musisoli TaxID=2802280 RepID=A0ABS1PD93_9ACTN|nr:helix-turn-helix transcriptional regulator [Streptomyces musisoli]MBL1110357.1 AAA family ATPase [Streptomyces musisoli]